MTLIKIKDMKRFVLAALVGVLVSRPNPASGAAEFYVSGGILTNFCKASPNVSFGYVLGVVDVLRGVYGSTPEFLR